MYNQLNYPDYQKGYSMDQLKCPVCQSEYSMDQSKCPICQSEYSMDQSKCPSCQQEYSMNQPKYPGYQSEYSMEQPNLRQLDSIVNPIVLRGVREAQYTSVAHAIKEVALVSYLMGMGYDSQMAYKAVESLETDETFPFQNKMMY